MSTKTPSLLIELVGQSIDSALDDTGYKGSRVKLIEAAMNRTYTIRQKIVDNSQNATLQEAKRIMGTKRDDRFLARLRELRDILGKWTQQAREQGLLK